MDGYWVVGDTGMTEHGRVLGGGRNHCHFAGCSGCWVEEASLRSVREGDCKVNSVRCAANIPALRKACAQPGKGSAAAAHS